MRSHFLRDLHIAGRETALALEPEFDFYRAAKVTMVTIECEGNLETAPTLQLKLTYEAASKRYALGLVFAGIRELVLPPMAPLLFVPELEIEDVRDRMMEGIRFEAVSHFERAFRCSCADISVSFFQPI